MIYGKINIQENGLFVEAFFGDDYRTKEITIHMIKATTDKWIRVKLSKEERNLYRQLAINTLKKKVGEMQ